MQCYACKTLGEFAYDVSSKSTGTLTTDVYTIFRLFSNPRESSQTMSSIFSFFESFVDNQKIQKPEKCKNYVFLTTVTV